ncbi:hypothetical protein ACRAWF_20635 [Streptomyces sp. L7]
MTLRLPSAAPLLTPSRTAVLEGIAGYVPPDAVANDALPAAWGVDDAWVRRRTGIRERRRAAPGVTTGDLALEAAGRALSAVGRPAVDAVIVATSTPDRPSAGHGPGSPPASASVDLPPGTCPPRAVDSSTACRRAVGALTSVRGPGPAGRGRGVLDAPRSAGPLRRDPVPATAPGRPYCGVAHRTSRARCWLSTSAATGRGTS